MSDPLTDLDPNHLADVAHAARALDDELTHTMQELRVRIQAGTIDARDTLAEIASEVERIGERLRAIPIWLDADAPEAEQLAHLAAVEVHERWEMIHHAVDFVIAELRAPGARARDRVDRVALRGSLIRYESNRRNGDRADAVRARFEREPEAVRRETTASLVELGAALTDVNERLHRRAA